jgi:hypothetical protein
MEALPHRPTVEAEIGRKEADVAVEEGCAGEGIWRSKPLKTMRALPASLADRIQRTISSISCRRQTPNRPPSASAQVEAGSTAGSGRAARRTASSYSGSSRS